MTDLRELYGTCQAEPCMCRRVRWHGTLCPHWQPMGPRTQEELAMWHRAASTPAPAPAIPVAQQEERKHADH